MIDFLKTQYQTTDFDSTQETRVVATLPLVACFTMSRASKLYVENAAEFRLKMAREVRKAIWAGAYHELIGPIKELQAKALMHARLDSDVADVREICARIDKLLEYPK
jgi:hypothetical protein